MNTAHHTYEALCTLFSETAKAHHEAFLASDGVDPEWPLWYAERLQEPLGELLGKDFTVSELVYLLVAAERHTHAVPSWQESYAHYFLACA